MKRKKKNRDWHMPVYLYYNDPFCSNDPTVKCSLGYYEDHSDDIYYISPYEVTVMLPDGKRRDFGCCENEGEVYGFADTGFCVWYEERNDEAAMQTIINAYDKDISSLMRQLEHANNDKKIAMNNGITYIEQEED